MPVKKIILVLSIFAIMGASANQAVGSGMYICDDVEAYPGHLKNLAEALNKMNCDTAKPFTVNKTFENTNYYGVCCVQK